MTDDRTEARDLLGLLVADEPPVAIDSKALVRKARTRQVVTHSVTFGGVALGVVGVVLFASLARPGPGRPGEEVSAAATPPGVGGMTITTFAPGQAPGGLCVQDQPGCTAPQQDEDARSKALTQAIQGNQGQFVPTGLTAVADPVGWDKVSPFRIVHVVQGDEQQQWAYMGSARIGDSSGGYGTVTVSVDNQGFDGRCASVDKSAQEERNGHKNNEKLVEFVGCADETLADGTIAAVQKYEGRNSGGFTSQEGYRRTVADAVKPDGTRIRVKVDNHGPDRLWTGHTPTRATVPLADQDIFTLIQLPGVKW